MLFEVDHEIRPYWQPGRKNHFFSQQLVTIYKTEKHINE